MLGAAWSLTGCGAAPQSLSILFPEPDKAPVTASHRPRRPPFKLPAPVEEPMGPEEPPPPDYTAIYQTLPRDEDGHVQWVRALADKLITPKPGLAPDAKDEEPTDMDVELVPKGQPEMKVVFSHKVHTAWVGCNSCHTALFEMEAGKTVITMDKINDGAQCGVCHGKVALPEPSGCPACHLAMGK